MVLEMQLCKNEVKEKDPSTYVTRLKTFEEPLLELFCHEEGNEHGKHDMLVPCLLPMLRERRRSYSTENGGSKKLASEALLKGFQNLLSQTGPAFNVLNDLGLELVMHTFPDTSKKRKDGGRQHAAQFVSFGFKIRRRRQVLADIMADGPEAVATAVTAAVQAATFEHSMALEPEAVAGAAAAVGDAPSLEDGMDMAFAAAAATVEDAHALRDAMLCDVEAYEVEMDGERYHERRDLAFAAGVEWSVR